MPGLITWPPEFVPLPVDSIYSSYTYPAGRMAEPLVVSGFFKRKCLLKIISPLPSTRAQWK